MAKQKLKFYNPHTRKPYETDKYVIKEKSGRKVAIAKYRGKKLYQFV